MLLLTHMAHVLTSEQVCCKCLCWCFASWLSTSHMLMHLSQHVCSGEVGRATEKAHLESTRVPNSTKRKKYEANASPMNACTHTKEGSRTNGCLLASMHNAGCVAQVYVCAMLRRECMHRNRAFV